MRKLFLALSLLNAFIYFLCYSKSQKPLFLATAIIWCVTSMLEIVMIKREAARKLERERRWR